MKLFFSSKKKKGKTDETADDQKKDAVKEPYSVEEPPDLSDDKPEASAPETDVPESTPENQSPGDTDNATTADLRLFLGDSTDLSLLLSAEDEGVGAVAGASVPQRAATAREDVGSVAEPSEDMLYRRLLNGLYDGVLLVDAKGTVFCNNQRAARFFGYSDAEFWNMSIEKLIRGVNVKVLFKIRTHTESGRFTVINAVCKCKDGSTFPAEIAINHLGLFNKDDMIFSIRNIARREKSRHMQDLRDDAIRGAGAALVVCDTDGLVEFANPAFIRMSGSASEQDVLKRFMGDFFTANETVNAMLRTPSDSGTWMGNLELLSGNGKCRNVLAIANLAPERPQTTGRRLVVSLTPVPRAAAMGAAAAVPETATGDVAAQ